MLRYLKIKVFAMLFLIPVMFLYSCTQKSIVDKTSVICFAGSVEITRGVDAPRPVVLGEELKQGDIIKTGPASFMVFNLGDTATVRIQPDTVATLSGITDKSDIDINLTSGGILNRVNKLAKGGTYKISTPTVVASVRGTVFSTYYTDKTNTVAVKTGSVNVSMKDKDYSSSLNDGKTAVIKDGIVERPIDEVESIILENMTSLPAEIKSLDKAAEEQLNRQIIEKDIETNKKLEGKIIPPTLEEIKKKYERIDEVLLYSGRIIRGVILERGAYYKILTTSGYVSIPAKQVRNTKVIR
ncbi:MAG: hypothetical protein GXY14_05945 [Spirochaetes bacterium]|nr:hypothetical protein [Spirochaetota bacterium]